jgi:hypothetical protein
MAEFGINATQLSAPQGAGSNVVQPVAPIDYSQTLKNLGSIFVNGVKQYKENQAQAAEQAVVSSFSREMGSLNQALASGQLKPDVHAMRARALTNQYLASNSQYTKQLQEVYRGFQSATELGTSQDIEKAARDQKNALIRDAQQAGRNIDTSWMSERAVDSELKSYQASVRLTKEWERQRAENAEKRSQGEYDIKMEDRENKRSSLQLITHLADNEMGAFTKFTSEISDKVKSGKLNTEQATMLVNERYGKINGAIQAASGLNPEMAGPYKGLFKETYEAALKFIDPKNSAEDAENFLKTIQNRAKIGTLLGNADLFKASTLSALFGHSPSLALNANVKVSEALVGGIKDPTGADVFNSIIGSPEAKDYFSKINEASKLNNASKSRSPQSDAEVKNLYNNAVNGIVDHAAIPRMTAKDLSQSAEFLSSPGFAEQVKSGGVPPEKMAELANVFQVKYSSTIRDLVSKKLNEPLKAVSFDSPGYSVLNGKVVRNKPPASANLPVKDIINVTFTGGGIGFALKDTKSLDSKQVSAATGIMKELGEAKRAVDQLIRLGAHFEGTTDYSGYFEKNKHLILPDLFKAPEKTPASSSSSVKYKNEGQMKEAVAGLDSAEGVTADALKGVLDNLGSLTAEQKKQLEIALKGMGN